MGATMQTITVTYPGGKYPIYIGEHLLTQASLLQQHIVSKQVMVVTNEVVAPLYLQNIRDLLAGYQLDSLIIPDGEAHKTLAQMSQILDALISRGHHRDTTLLALGGGVVGDMVGFTAACFQRGVDFIQIPTTLLAQVDASIGGKTAVNHPLGKNLIGAFHQPRAVLIDIATLASLPARHYHAGLTEIIKAALIRDADFFVYLEQHINELMHRDSSVVVPTVARACAIKRDIVALDERERNIRALLNLGHTFGHAIEQNQGYVNCLHGEAVAIGIVLAAKLSAHLQWLNQSDVERIINLLQLAQLPANLPANSEVEQLVIAMRSDKKILANRMRLILLQGIGNGVITDAVSEDEIRQLLSQQLPV